MSLHADSDESGRDAPGFIPETRFTRNEGAVTFTLTTSVCLCRSFLCVPGKSLLGNIILFCESIRFMFFSIKHCFLVRDGLFFCCEG